MNMIKIGLGIIGFIISLLFISVISKRYNIHKIGNIYFGQLVGFDGDANYENISENDNYKTIKLNGQVIKMDKNKFFG